MDTNYPLISVIIPVYRTEQYLPQCVASVQAQSYKNLEIILVDDGSEDNGGALCDEYATKDRRIKVIHQDNRGLAGARNSGLNIAQGEYIGFVDSDDYIEPDMYAYLYHLITQDNASMSMCNICSDEGYHGDRQAVQPYLLIPALKIFQFRHWVYAWNKLYRKDFIASERFSTATSYGEDELFNFELMKTNGSVALGNQAKYHYRRNQNPMALTKNFQPEHINKIILTEKCIQYAKEHNLPTYYRRSSVMQLLLAAIWLQQIAFSSKQDMGSVKFLTGYIKKHLVRFLLTRSIHWRRKLFVLVACINFNCARKMLLFFRPQS